MREVLRRVLLNPGMAGSKRVNYQARRGGEDVSDVGCGGGVGINIQEAGC